MSIRFDTPMRFAESGHVRRNGTRLQLVSSVPRRDVGVRRSARRPHWSAGKSQTRLSAYRQTGIVERSTGTMTGHGTGVLRKAAWLTLFAALASTLVSA